MPNLRAIALCLGFSLTSCSAGSGPSPSPGPSPTPSPTPGPSMTADYEVHEWGLVRQEATGDVMRIGGVAPPVQMRPVIMLKPILYFHTKTKLDLVSVSVSAPSGGSILEVWPLLHNGRTGENIGSRVEWAHVALDPTGACTLSPLPTISDPPCTALGADFCEVASLAVARTDEAACVTTNGTTDRFLFYRGRSATLRPPLVFGRRAAGEITVTHRGGARIPGKLVRIRTIDGVTIATATAPPEPKATISLPEPTRELSLEAPLRSSTMVFPPGASSIPLTMGELGLTREESDAFMRAWYPTLFPGREIQLDSNLSATKPKESVLYFLPAESNDDVAELGFSPAPRVVRRAIAVWTALP